MFALRPSSAHRAIALAAFALSAPLPLLLSACGQAALQGQVRQLDDRVATLQAQATRRDERLAELENRLSILADKLLALEVEKHAALVAEGAAALAIPANLPVVRLTPPHRAPKRSTPVTTGDGEVGGGGDASVGEVDGTTDAAVASLDPTPIQAAPAVAVPPHPVLRIDGAGNRDGAAGAIGESYPDPAEVTEKLPVVPLPDGPNRSQTSAPPAVPIATTAAATSSTDQEPAAAYGRAYRALQAGDLVAARSAFRAFLARWPHHALADHALYWLGETYYAEQDYATARAQFAAVVERFPTGAKAADALFKEALCALGQGDRKSAREILSRVTEQYPTSEAARLARARSADLAAGS